MNRRQKMKRMKQELEWYKNQMVPTRKVAVDSRQMRVETLRAREMYHQGRYIHENEMNIRSYLCNKIAENIYDYINFEQIVCTDTGLTTLTAELKVVVPHGGDRF